MEKAAENPIRHGRVFLVCDRTIMAATGNKQATTVEMTDVILSMVFPEYFSNVLSVDFCVSFCALGLPNIERSALSFEVVLDLPVFQYWRTL
jgi:hypothetical protein